MTNNSSESKNDSSSTKRHIDEEIDPHTALYFEINEQSRSLMVPVHMRALINGDLFRVFRYTDSGQEKVSYPAGPLSNKVSELARTVDVDGTLYLSGRDESIQVVYSDKALSEKDCP